jgi:hypothetical protein
LVAALTNDNIAEYNSDAGARGVPPKPTTTALEEAAKIAPESVHREELSDTDPGGGVDTYKVLWRAKRDNTRAALAAFDSMEGRAKVKAEPMILLAAEELEATRAYDEAYAKEHAKQTAAGASSAVADAAAVSVGADAAIDAKDKIVDIQSAKRAFKIIT